MHLVKNWYPQTGMILGYSAAGELVRPKHVYEFFLTKGVFFPLAQHMGEQYAGSPCWS